VRLRRAVEPVSGYLQSRDRKGAVFEGDRDEDALIFRDRCDHLSVQQYYQSLFHHSANFR
jgi:hypothetical protein